MGTLKERLERAVADKGLSIGDAWNLLSEALEYITAQQRTIELQGNEVRSLEARVATLTAEVMHYTAGASHQPVTVRGEPMACPCGKCP
jgi:hypothetical protein